jgi:hypothetical protein
LSTDVKLSEKKTMKVQIVDPRTMIEKKDLSPEEKLAQEEILKDMENSQKLMILMIIHFIKRKVKNFMLKNQPQRRKKKRHQRKTKTKRSNKFSIKKTMSKLALMKKEKTQMKKKRRRNNQEQRKDNLTVLPNILPILSLKLALSQPNIKNLRLQMKNMKLLKKQEKKPREKLRKQLRKLKKKPREKLRKQLRKLKKRRKLKQKLQKERNPRKRKKKKKA